MDERYRNVADKHIAVRTNDVPNVIGVDPGGTTGVATFSVRGFTSTHVPANTAVQFIEELVQQRVELGNVIVAVQRYVTAGAHGRHSTQHDALSIIGGLKLLETKTGLRGRVRVEVQNAADAAHIGKRDVLTLIDWWRPGMTHANDAAAHVALTMLRYFPAMWYRMTHPIG